MKKHSKGETRNKLVTRKQDQNRTQGSGKAVQEFLQKLSQGGQRLESQANNSGPAVSWYVGIDLGDKKSSYCFLNEAGSIVQEGKLATVATEFGEYFSAIPRSRIALEVGTHSPWVSELMESYGHEVFVANPRKMESIHKNKRKNDKVDSRTLARLVRADPELLYPIRHRSAEARRDLVLVRARDTLVSVRTKVINCVRGLVKSAGGRLPKCSAESFHKQVRDSIPESIRGALVPLLAEIGALTAKIRKYDRAVSRMTAEKYPETGCLKQIQGVGDVTSLAYVLTLESPERFEKSRDVGPYLGLVPKQYDSGESSPQLGITKTGDKMLRRLLVGSGHYILGPFGEDCDLRRFGLKLAASGGKKAKRRAVVAVARKLAVLLHRLWVTGEVYEPLRHKGLENLVLETQVNG